MLEFLHGNSHRHLLALPWEEYRIYGPNNKTYSQKYRYSLGKTVDTPLEESRKSILSAFEKGTIKEVITIPHGAFGEAIDPILIKKIENKLNKKKESKQKLMQKAVDQFDFVGLTRSGFIRVGRKDGQPLSESDTAGYEELIGKALTSDGKQTYIVDDYELESALRDRRNLTEAHGAAIQQALRVGYDHQINDGHHNYVTYERRLERLPAAYQEIWKDLCERGIVAEIVSSPPVGEASYAACHPQLREQIMMRQDQSASPQVKAGAVIQQGDARERSQR